LPPRITHRLVSSVLRVYILLTGVSREDAGFFRDRSDEDGADYPSRSLFFNLILWRTWVSLPDSLISGKQVFYGSVSPGSLETGVSVVIFKEKTGLL
jgi:hypothetical protein